MDLWGVRLFPGRPPSPVGWACVFTSISLALLKHSCVNWVSTLDQVQRVCLTKGANLADWLFQTPSGHTTTLTESELKILSTDIDRVGWCRREVNCGVKLFMLPQLIRGGDAEALMKSSTSWTSKAMKRSWRTCLQLLRSRDVGITQVTEFESVTNLVLIVPKWSHELCLCLHLLLLRLGSDNYDDKAVTGQLCWCINLPNGQRDKFWWQTED